MDVLELVTTLKPAARPPTPAATANQHDLLREAIRAERAGPTIIPDPLDKPRSDRPAEAIIGRAHKRRRLLRSGAAAVGLAAAATGLTLWSLNTGPSVQQVHLKLAAWTVNTQPGGRLTLTLVGFSRTAAVNEVPAVRAALARAGVPAEVVFGSVCTSSESLPQAVTKQVLPWTDLQITAAGGLTRVVVPSAIPPNAKLLISLDPIPVVPDNHNGGALHVQPVYSSAWLMGANVVPVTATIACHKALP